MVAVFENLLPDSDRLRQRVAEQVGASGTDAYSLLLEGTGIVPSGILKHGISFRPPNVHTCRGRLRVKALDEVARNATQAMENVEKQVPRGFPEALYASTRNGFLSRLKKIA